MPEILVDNFDKNKFKNTLTNAPVLGKVKLGVGRKRIFDAQNRIIGTVAGTKIYDLNNKLWGTIITRDSEAGFNKNEIVDRGTVIATIDRDKNIYRKQVSAYKAGTSSNVYLGTIRTNKVVAILLPLLISVVAITAISGVILGVILRQKTEPDYLKEAPVLGVYSNSVYPSNNWKQKKEIDIFNKGDLKTAIIAPGDSGNYIFAVKNENTHAIEYRITMKKDDEHNFNLVYRLALQLTGDSKRYVAGNSSPEGYLSPENVLPSSVVLAPGASHYYILEWLWQDNNTDEQNKTDTNIGAHQYSYNLELTVSAEYVG
ncbi:MAG: hypothetical protein IJT25_02865 [Clostridia bacterium]|nr:hypothetical protein [Clostridia bacterium]